MRYNKATAQICPSLTQRTGQPRYVLVNGFDGSIISNGGSNAGFTSEEKAYKYFDACQCSAVKQWLETHPEIRAALLAMRADETQQFNTYTVDVFLKANGFTRLPFLASELIKFGMPQKNDNANLKLAYAEAWLSKNPQMQALLVDIFNQVKSGTHSDYEKFNAKCVEETLTRNRIDTSKLPFPPSTICRKIEHITYKLSLEQNT